MSLKKFKTIAAVALSLAMCASAAACGTSDASDSNGGTKNGSSDVKAYDVSKIQKDEEIAAILPQSVTKDGKLTFGTDTSYAPAEFLAEDGKTPIGFDIDIAKALGKVLGIDTENQIAKFDMIIPSVGSKYDAGISSFTITPERMKAVDFVTFYKAGSTWVTKKGNPDKVDPENLCGMKIAVQTGTTQEEELTALNEKCVADGKDKIEVLSSALQTDVTTNVATGKASAFYADSPVAGYAISQTDGTLEALGEDVGVAKEGIIVKKGDKATAEALQKAMQKLMDDGTYDEILEFWGVESGKVDKAEINPSNMEG